MNVAVIGAGKMGRAIAKGLLDAGLLQPADLTGVSPEAADRTAFAALDSSHPPVCYESIPPALEGADTILIAVKPQQFSQIAPDLAQAAPSACLISIMAGIPITSLEAALGTNRPIIRTMPNTPLMIGKGAVAWCGNANLSEDQRSLPHTIFQALGCVVEVEEDQLDAVTALSGSGPAYVYLFLQHLIAAAVQEGLHPEHARLLATQTALGAASLMQQSGLPPEDLINQVRSKGGTTHAGLTILEDASGSFADLTRQAVAAAAQRSRELARS